MSEEFKNDNNDFDLIVIGAGITGVGVYHQAITERGLKTLLIDEHGISEQTSSKSSKMLHGGIRYLENFQFKLVYEALKERNYWLKRRPDQVKVNTFILPLPKNHPYPAWLIHLGLKLYQWLSFSKNTKIIRYKKGQWSEFIGLETSEFKAIFSYEDTIVDDQGLAKVLVSEIEESHQSLGHTHFYDGVIKIQKNQQNNKYQVLTRSQKTFVSPKIALCLGPFSFKFLKDLNLSYPKNYEMILSQGSHLWLAPLKLNQKSYVLTTPEGRIVFLINHQDKYLLGTTERLLNQVTFQPEVSPEEKKELLDAFSHYFPHHEKPKILGQYTGIRPLVAKKKSSNKSDQHRISRNHEIFEIDSNHILCITGGKYTTFYKMAKDLLNRLFP